MMLTSLPGDSNVAHYDGPLALYGLEEMNPRYTALLAVYEDITDPDTQCLASVCLTHRDLQALRDWADRHLVRIQHEMREDKLTPTT